MRDKPEMKWKWLMAAGAASMMMGSQELLAPRLAEACGCFAPPDPTVP